MLYHFWVSNIDKLTEKQIHSIFINLISGEECQRNGEKFQPIGGKKKNYDMEDSNEDETGSDVDSLSDLYPGSRTV